MEVRPERDTVRVGDLEVDRAPVTNARYAAFVDATGHRPPVYWEDGVCPESLAQHPSWAFGPGYHTVSLTVSNAAASSTATRQNLIYVETQPVANFSALPTTGCVPFAATFTNTSVAHPHQSPVGAPPAKGI